MFEKEGIRYAFEETIGTDCLSKPIEDFHFIDLSDEQQEKAQCFKDGAEFGYNKANEWHYPSKGELPQTQGWYVVQYNDCAFDCVVLTKDLRFVNFDTCKDMTEAVYAWKEIVLPKESEDEQTTQSKQIQST